MITLLLNRDESIAVKSTIPRLFCKTGKFDFDPEPHFFKPTDQVIAKMSEAGNVSSKRIAMIFNGFKEHRTIFFHSEKLAGTLVKVKWN